MADTSVPARPIARGYPETVKVTVTDFGGGAPFPEGCALEVQFREYVGAPTVLATCSTLNGKLTRVDDDTVLLKLDRDDTAAMEGQVVADIVRTDLTPDEYLGVQMFIPVVKPATVTVAG